MDQHNVSKLDPSVTLAFVGFLVPTVLIVALKGENFFSSKLKKYRKVRRGSTASSLPSLSSLSPLLSLLNFAESGVTEPRDSPSS